MLELCVCIAIMSLLISLLFPAIQAARESARRVSCSNNLRQVAMGAIQDSIAMRRLPESRYWLSPSGDTIERELPWGRRSANTIVNADATWCNADHGFAECYQKSFEKAPFVYRCPSSISPSQLTDLPQRIGDRSTSRVVSETSDYRGNGGIRDTLHGGNWGQRQGPFSVVRGTSNSKTEASLVDGLSNTVYMWETIGSKFAQHKSGRIELSDWRDVEIFNRYILFDPRFEFDQDTAFEDRVSTTRAFNVSWAGNATGYLFFFRYIDSSGIGRASFLKSNRYGDPFSLHQVGICVANCDGSIRWLERNVSENVVRKLLCINDEQTILQE